MKFIKFPNSSSQFEQAKLSSEMTALKINRGYVYFSRLEKMSSTSLIIKM